MSGPSQEVYEMGNLIRLRNDIDPEQRATNFIRSHLAIVEMYPIQYTYALNKVNKKNGFALNYDFDSAKTSYHNVLQSYKLPVKDGLRMYLTDDTTAVDEFSNEFGKNAIETAVTGLSGLSTGLQTMRDLAKSSGAQGEQLLGGIQNMSTAAGNQGVEALSNLLPADSGLRQTFAGLATSSLGTVAEMVFKGKQISLPRIWQASNYSPSLTLSLKLISPYGDPKAVKEFIIKPLMYLLALISPKTNDGVSYGLTQPLRIVGYGITNINIGVVESLSMRRGGRETAFNVHKQPLVMDIVMSVKPLAMGYAAFDTKNTNDDVATIDDAAEFYTHPSTSPSVTTLGNIVQSLRPSPEHLGIDVVKNHHEESDIKPACETGGVFGGGKYGFSKNVLGSIAGQYVQNAVDYSGYS